MTRWYVTLTWDDWPEGGSYGTVVQAETYDAAVATAKREMAETRDDAFHSTPEEADAAAERLLEALGDEWHVVDCFKLDDFLAEHAPLRVEMTTCTRKAEPLRMTEKVGKVEFPDHTPIEVLRGYPTGLTWVLRGAKLAGTINLMPMLEVATRRLKAAEQEAP